MLSDCFDLLGDSLHCFELKGINTISVQINIRSHFNLIFKFKAIKLLNSFIIIIMFVCAIAPLKATSFKIINTLLGNILDITNPHTREHCI